VVHIGQYSEIAYYKILKKIISKRGIYKKKKKKKKKKQRKFRIMKIIYIGMVIVYVEKEIQMNKN